MKSVQHDHVSGTPAARRAARRRVGRAWLSAATLAGRAGRRCAALAGAVRPHDRAATVFRTAGSIGFRNTPGTTPMKIAIAQIGRDHEPLAHAEIAQAAILRRSSAGRSSRAGTSTACRPPTESRRSRRPPCSTRMRRLERAAAERADQDQELADEAVHPGQRDRRQRDQQERRDELRRDRLQAADTRRSAACAGDRTACRR